MKLQLNIANQLTIVRIVAIPLYLLVLYINKDWSNVAATIIFILAGVSDFLDGYIARKYNMITDLGKILDPIADKILVIVAMLILVEAGRMPAWIPAIVVIREFIVSGYRLVAVEKSGKVIAASIWGKIKTCTQMIGITLAFIDVNSFGAIFTGNLAGFPFVLNLCTTLLLSISVIATIFSGIDYLKGSKELFKGEM